MNSGTMKQVTSSMGSQPNMPSPEESVAGSAGSGVGSSAGRAQGHPGADASELSPAGSGSKSSGIASRQTFAMDELAIVLSNYDLGTIDAIQVFPRGSRKAPKLVIRAESGMYLLKRRAQGRDDPRKVAFCHGIQLHLAERQFPLPHLIGTRRDQNSLLKWDGGTYELFEYIKGNSYDHSLEATTEGGRILALFHKLLKDHKAKYESSRGSYHASRNVSNSANRMPSTLRQVEPDADFGQIDRITQFLHESYKNAAQAVQDAGLPRWPMQVVHADWHPGNMLFRGKRAVAVIDYDSARIQQRILDTANGALQFSITGGGDDATKWPDYIDESRFKRFIRGYDSVPEAVLSRAELRVTPHLMIEALIAESVIPIAATGYFSRMHGSAFLGMVERKVRWLQEHGEELIASVEA